MNNKFRYVLFPDRRYTIKLEDIEFELSGEQIFALIDRALYVHKDLKISDLIQ